MLKEQGNQLMGAPGSCEKVGIHLLDYTASSGRKRLQYFLDHGLCLRNVGVFIWKEGLARKWPEPAERRVTGLGWVRLQSR